MFVKISKMDWGSFVFLPLININLTPLIIFQVANFYLPNKNNLQILFLRRSCAAGLVLRLLSLTTIFLFKITLN